MSWLSAPKKDLWLPRQSLYIEKDQHPWGYDIECADVPVSNLGRFLKRALLHRYLHEQDEAGRYKTLATKDLRFAGRSESFTWNPTPMEP